jgi:hypothetical protein
VKRLLLDQGLPRSTAGLLSQGGWDVVHVSEIGMSRADDREILREGAPLCASASHSMRLPFPARDQRRARAISDTHPEGRSRCNRACGAVANHLAKG